MNVCCMLVKHYVNANALNLWWGDTQRVYFTQQILYISQVHLNVTNLYFKRWNVPATGAHLFCGDAFWNNFHHKFYCNNPFYHVPYNRLSINPLNMILQVKANTPILMCSVPGFDASGRVEDLSAEQNRQITSIAIGKRLQTILTNINNIFEYIHVKYVISAIINLYSK